MITKVRRWIGENNHKIQGYIWIFLGIPTIVWWKDSVLWVALMSIYANAEASFSADQAKEARKENKDK
ncbi:hypothetical protein SEA_GODONK_90 [Gordonia phage GodonK]|uniref:Uncharacterized protein n=1 Tax=Gordonia phage GodonK TaxID=2562192 RepID=A0A4D6E215_9CAUD|nr:hypothetical protein HOV33_gp090 [Gordonia phage GodonK]QBZ72709.1 hypothetical protein SEA_GODONK_90 [Gordonia phage GodonK]